MTAMTANQINRISRAAVEKARKNKERDQRYYCIEEMVRQEIYSEGFAWSGHLDGSDRSIRAVEMTLKRDDKEGRIHDMRNV